MKVLEVLYQWILGLYDEIRFRLYHGPVFHRFLNRKYHYYTKLPWPLKMRFLRLVRDHYEYFDFVGREMKVTRGMKAIVSAAAAQLVMYLPQMSLTYFERIVIYPDYYNSRITHKLHKGEVNPGFHLIVFSWRGVMEGLARDEDGLNLLLHEFAHALWLETKLMSENYRVLPVSVMVEFEKLAEREMNALHADEQHFFRRYAFANIEEFFAVAVESFFERPESFSRQLPELYQCLIRMFRQNPLLPGQRQ
ncbi:MAG: zinc-dependent peptidase [Cyclobacteriaceae bacterium]|nr:zinc-dependent peptidase [Cyclobacteriaceae bacterium]